MLTVLVLGVLPTSEVCTVKLSYVDFRNQVIDALVYDYEEDPHEAKHLVMGHEDLVDDAYREGAPVDQIATSLRAVAQYEQL